MGDSQRFKVFSKEIENKFPSKKYKRIADIAGGKGHLNKELSDKGYNVITFDKWVNKRSGVTYIQKYFNNKIKDKFDLLVRMHPDEATDIIITEAAKRGIPFAIVPCCIMPVNSHYNGNAVHVSWVHHLDMYARKLGFKTAHKQIKISGKNIMLWGNIS